MISAERLKPYLDDYQQTTGNHTDQFICPITLQPCREADLIEGHILNNGFRKASSRTVVQFGPIDHYYGTRVEETFVAFLNMKDASPHDFFKVCEEIMVEFNDGSNAEAFPATGVSAKHANGRFPRVSGVVDGAEHTVFVKTTHDDRRLRSPFTLLFKSRPFCPAHFSAAMLKAGYLTMFDMLGYRAIYDPCADTLRRTLKTFYTANASREDAALFFADFRYATKLGGTGQTPADLLTNYKQMPLDSLDRQQLLFLYTPHRKLFAIMCIFQVNDATVTVTLPSALENSDIEMVWSYYRRFVNDENPPHRIHPGEFRNGQWQVRIEPLAAHMITDDQARVLFKVDA